MFSKDYKKETAQEWAQNPLSERFLYFVIYLRPSNNSRASFTVFTDSSGYSYELLRDLLWPMRRCDRVKRSKNKNGGNWTCQKGKSWKT